jgi:hypothetical protein
MTGFGRRALPAGMGPIEWIDDVTHHRLLRPAKEEDPR